MGWWKTERGTGGDTWADIMDKAIQDLQNWSAEPNQSINLGELADLIEFCTRGHLTVEIREGVNSSMPLHNIGKAVQTYPNRGQIHKISQEEKEEK